MTVRPSPYELVLGEQLAALHPALGTYFSAIPAGHVGVGHGVFAVVGTPRRWLWPALAVLARGGILFPVWEHEVPFTVTNTPSSGTRVAVIAGRVFRFASGERTMVDEISAEGGVLLDRLGAARRLVAGFEAQVHEGALRMLSTTVGLRAGRCTVWLPRWAAPVVALEERYDEAAALQRVSVVVAHPLLGRLYEYAGSFTYAIRAEGAA